MRHCVKWCFRWNPAQQKMLLNKPFAKVMWCFSCSKSIVSILIKQSDILLSISERRCKLHVDYDYNDLERIIPFTESSLDICHKKQSIRMKIQKRPSKFDQIILPTYADGISGYHSMCYKYFSSIREKAGTFSGNEYSYGHLIVFIWHFSRNTIAFIMIKLQLLQAQLRIAHHWAVDFRFY